MVRRLELQPTLVMAAIRPYDNSLSWTKEVHRPTQHPVRLGQAVDGSQEARRIVLVGPPQTAWSI